MSMLRRIRRQVKDNIRSGKIRRAGFTGRRKKMARHFLKKRDKERETNSKQREAKPATWKNETHAATDATSGHVAGETHIVETATGTP